MIRRLLLMIIALAAIGLVFTASKPTDQVSAKTDLKWKETSSILGECYLDDDGHIKQENLVTFTCSEDKGKDDHCILGETKVEKKPKNNCSTEKAYCHANEGVSGFVYLNNTAWIQHLRNNGSPQAGHEGDFLTWVGDRDCVGYTEVCTDPKATNYDSRLSVNEKSDDSVCEYGTIRWCFLADGGDHEYYATTVPDDGNTPESGKPWVTGMDRYCETQTIEILGCMDEEASNYDSEATKDDGSCEYKEDEPESTPTPTPTSSVGRDFYSEPWCDGHITLHFTFTESDGKGAVGKDVKFTYANETAERKTDSDGKARVDFPFKGESEAKVYFDGTDMTTTVKAAENCPATTGQVLGATTGKVLGASTLAATGVSADIIMNLLGLSGTALAMVGVTKYGKKN